MPGLGVGAWMLVSIVAIVALASPWAFGRVRMPDGGLEPRWSAQSLQLSLLPPSWNADAAADARVQLAESQGRFVPGRLLGTDRLGRDVLARLLAGSAISLALGLSAALVATAVGVLWGAAAACGSRGSSPCWRRPSRAPPARSAAGGTSCGTTATSTPRAMRARWSAA